MKSSTNHGWSFRDRTFIWAGGLSLLWHAFWFFSITIVVSPDLKKMNARPRMVSLGPVLDDTIFRTLVETRPQLSQTFYRPEPDFSSSMDADVATFKGQAPGEVVSVPFSRKFMSSLRELVGGTKSSPNFDFTPRLPIAYPGGEGEVEGAVSSRRIVSRPSKPKPPLGSEPGSAGSETVIDFTVDPSGVVVAARVITSGGFADADEAWLGYVKDFRFTASGGGNQSGRIRLSFGESE